MSLHRNCAVVFLNFGLAAVCFASSTPRVSFEELVDRSDSIISGRVVRSWPAWDRSHQFIWTHHELAVKYAIKGSAAKSVIVSEPGGTVDGMTMVIPGTVQFPEGQDLLLFLYKTPIGYLRTVGEEQGEYVVAADGRLQGASISLPAINGLPARELKLRIEAFLHRKRENLEQ
ncbi:MAG: hypothetical protein ACR2I2_06700 [Bryobacteraceae bacterium]